MLLSRGRGWLVALDDGAGVDAGGAASLGGSVNRTFIELRHEGAFFIYVRLLGFLVIHFLLKGLEIQICESIIFLIFLLLFQLLIKLIILSAWKIATRRNRILRHILFTRIILFPSFFRPPLLLFSWIIHNCWSIEFILLSFTPQLIQFFTLLINLGFEILAVFHQLLVSFLSQLAYMIFMNLLMMK